MTTLHRHTPGQQRSSFIGSHTATTIAMFAVFFITATSHVGPTASTKPLFKPSVGIIVAGDSSVLIIQGLEQSGLFGVINATDAFISNVTSEWMKQFDVLLYFSDYALLSPDTFGNHLADYLDAGGAVVTGVFQTQTCCAQTIAGGRFAEEYQVLVPNVHDANDDTTYVGDVYFPQHPIMQNLANFSTVKGLSHMVFANNSLEPNSYILSRFRDDTYIAVVRDAVGPSKHNRVDLGFWPSPAFDQNITGAINIVIQSLLYALGPAYISWPANVTSCTIPEISSFLPNVTGLSVVSQSPAASTILKVGQTSTLSFSVKLPGPSVFTGNLEVQCPTGSSSAASRTLTTVEAIKSWICQTLGE